MATIERFGTSIRRQPRAEEKADIEFLSKRMGIDLLRAFDDLARQGIMSPEEISQLMRETRKAAAFERKQLATGLRKGSLGRRLGARSGAIDNFVANKVFAPSFAGTATQHRDLLKQNYFSRLQGLQGSFDVARYLSDRSAQDRQLELEEPGALDFVGAATGIGEGIAGIVSGNPALVADGVRRTFDDGTSGGVA